MTHEADTSNFSMSLEDDPLEAAFRRSINKARLRKDHFSAAATVGRSEQEIRMTCGRWSLEDKMEWQCKACTFLNQPLFLSCDICGEARPPRTEPLIPPEARADTSAEDILIAEEALRTGALGEFALEGEVGGALKQDRIKEIMALQQGIFNKIREENEEHRVEELEGSFAWMDLAPEEDTLTELPAATSRVSCGGAYAKDGGLGKKGPAGMDGSSATAATSAMSSFSGSSRFNLDWSTNSQHSRLSGGNRNSAIPEQALASLKEESAQGSYLRGSLGMGSSSHAHHHNSQPNVEHGYVDFGALRAVVEGSPVRFLDLGDHSSGHSGRYSNHSLTESPETVDYTRRGGDLESSLSYLNGLEDFHLEEKAIGAVSMAGTPSKKWKGEEQGLGDLPSLSPIGAMSVPGAPAGVTGKKSNKKDSHKDSKYSPGMARSAPAAAPAAPQRWYVPIHSEVVVPEVPVEDARKSSPKESKKKKSRSVSPKEKVEKSNSGKGLGIPLFNRMLRKKNQAKAAETN